MGLHWVPKSSFKKQSDTEAVGYVFKVVFWQRQENADPGQRIHSFWECVRACIKQLQPAVAATRDHIKAVVPSD